MGADGDAEDQGAEDSKAKAMPNVAYLEAPPLTPETFPSITHGLNLSWNLQRCFPQHSGRWLDSGWLALPGGVEPAAGCLYAPVSQSRAGLCPETPSTWQGPFLLSLWGSHQLEWQQWFARRGNDSLCSNDWL